MDFIMGRENKGYIPVQPENFPQRTDNRRFLFHCFKNTSSGKPPVFPDRGKTISGDPELAPATAHDTGAIARWKRYERRGQARPEDR